MLQYLRYLTASFFLALLVAGSVSYLLDPLGYFRINGLRATSFLGDRVWGDDRTVKSLALPGMRPDTLLLGSSRVKLGFDLTDPGIHKYLGNTYNLALAGAGTAEIDKLTRYALNYHIPSNIVIGLDFGMFVVPHEINIPEFVNHDASFAGRIVGMMHRLSFALWSKVALEYAADMVFKNNYGYLNGTRDLTNKKKRLKRIGVKALSRHIEKISAKRLMRNKNSSAYKMNMATLNQLVSYVCSKNIRIKLFVTPLHVRQLLLLRTIGFQERFYSWKRELSDIYERYQSNGCEIDVVDFSRISKFTTYPLLSIGDLKTSPHWYWESSHYTAELGKLIIYRLWGRTHTPYDFGVNLNNQIIDSEIETSREELIYYQNMHPDLANELRDVVLK